MGRILRSLMNWCIARTRASRARIFELIRPSSIGDLTAHRATKGKLKKMKELGQASTTARMKCEDGTRWCSKKENCGGPKRCTIISLGIPSNCQRDGEAFSRERRALF